MGNVKEMGRDVLSALFFAKCWKLSVSAKMGSPMDGERL